MSEAERKLTEVAKDIRALPAGRNWTRLQAIAKRIDDVALALWEAP